MFLAFSTTLPRFLGSPGRLNAVMPPPRWRVRLTVVEPQLAESKGRSLSYQASGRQTMQHAYSRSHTNSRRRPHSAFTPAAPCITLIGCNCPPLRSSCRGLVVSHAHLAANISDWLFVDEQILALATGIAAACAFAIIIPAYIPQDL